MGFRESSHAASTHVAQRGNWRQRMFMGNDDDALCGDSPAYACRSNGVEVGSYCPLTNHVDLYVLPSDQTGLSRAVGETPLR